VTTADAASFVKAGSQLEQLAAMTVLSIDSGDIHTIEKFAATGFITDATTNPLFGKHLLALHAVRSMR
jgi:transaldolase